MIYLVLLLILVDAGIGLWALRELARRGWYR
ncbi:hypothetical protein P3T27_001352 [Kitasatospora sp. MAA19]|nr:hypothetical protein [Kitasatospora sp. MAA19]